MMNNDDPSIDAPAHQGSQMLPVRHLNSLEIIRLFENSNPAVEGLTRIDQAAINKNMYERRKYPGVLTELELKLARKIKFAMSYVIITAFSLKAISAMKRICFSENETVPDYIPKLQRIGGLALLSFFGLVTLRLKQTYSAHQNATTAIYLANAVASGRARVYLGTDRSKVIVESTSTESASHRFQDHQLEMV